MTLDGWVFKVPESEKPPGIPVSSAPTGPQALHDTAWLHTPAPPLGYRLSASGLVSLTISLLLCKEGLLN